MAGCGDRGCKRKPCIQSQQAPPFRPAAWVGMQAVECTSYAQQARQWRELSVAPLCPHGPAAWPVIFSPTPLHLTGCLTPPCTSGLGGSPPREDRTALCPGQNKRGQKSRRGGQRERRRWQAATAATGEHPRDMARFPQTRSRALKCDVGSGRPQEHTASGGERPLKHSHKWRSPAF